MSVQRYSPGFQGGAVRQELERGYSVCEVVQWLSVSALSLYKWVRGINSGVIIKWPGVVLVCACQRGQA